MCRKFILFFGGMLYTSLDMRRVKVEETAICFQYCKAVRDATCVGDHHLVIRCCYSFIITFLYHDSHTSVSDFNFSYPIPNSRYTSLHKRHTLNIYFFINLFIQINLISGNCSSFWCVSICFQSSFHDGCSHEM